jgi:hypothetical protein
MDISDQEAKSVNPEQTPKVVLADLIWICTVVHIIKGVSMD